MDEQQQHESTETHIASSGEESEIVSEAAETFAGELEYADGPDPSEQANVARSRRNKRRVGRPTLEEAAREKTRLRVQKFRAKQPQGIQKSWIDARAALPSEQREVFEQQQTEVAALQSEMNACIKGTLENRLPEDLFPDLLYVRIRRFIHDHPLVVFWVPDLTANLLDPEDWDQCDDRTFRDFGYRCHLVQLFHRVFISACDKWVKQNPEMEMEPGVADEIRQLHIAYEPAPEPKYIPDPIKVQSERNREKYMRARQKLEEITRFHQNEFIKYQTGQDGSHDGF